MPVTFDDGKEACTVRAEDDVDITSSAELKQILLQAMARGGKLQVDLSHAGNCDITAIQLLWAAGRDAEKAGTPFVIIGQMPEHIRRTVREVGLEGLFNTGNSHE